MFRKVYPFSPALVQTLIAVSSVLQRERTALKVMMQLLVDQRETLKVGDIVPVGDLFDVIAHGDEAFSQEMAIHFDNAKRLYHQKLLPVLEKQHGRREDLEKLPYDDPKRAGLPQRRPAGEDAAAGRPGARGRVAAGAQRRAAGRPEPRHDPDADPGHGRAGGAAALPDLGGERGRDPHRRGDQPDDLRPALGRGHREHHRAGRGARTTRGTASAGCAQMLFEQLGIAGRGRVRAVPTSFSWRNTKRSCIVLFKNIRELPDSSLENAGDELEAGHRLPV